MKHGRPLALGLIIVGASAGAFAACVGDVGTSVVDAGSEAGNSDSASGCAARTADDATGIFVVAATGSDVKGCGTRASPCKSVQYGVFSATQTGAKTTVYISASPQPYVESVTLTAGISLEGGWLAKGTNWTPICDATTSKAVTIQGVTNTTITAAFNGTVTLRDLTIASKAPASGESLYGIIATGSSTNLTLDAVAVNVATGGAGADGVAGANGSDGMGYCPPGDGGAGAMGATGSGATPGSLTPTGYAKTNGADSGGGTPGASGTAGGATCVSGCSTCKNGCTFGTGTVCSTAGPSGCGGAPGAGGSGGLGGGSSVALYVWDAHITTFGGTLTSGAGGSGGNGGNGGSGGAGAGGDAGSNATCPTQLACSGGFCVFVSGNPVNAGPGGGSGGSGGAGAQGGGGSGGFSYAVVQGGTANIQLNGGTTLAHGSAGAGGAVGGAVGTSADRWP